MPVSFRLANSADVVYNIALMDGVDFDLLWIDINVDLQRLGTNITVDAVEPIFEYPDAYRLAYTDHDNSDNSGSLIGLMISNVDYASYEERHIWTMDNAEALTIVQEVHQRDD